MNHDTTWKRRLTSLLVALAFVATAMPVFGGVREAAAVAAGDISIDFVAAGPGTYKHDTGDAKSAGLGDYDGRVISKTNGVVESLEGGDFACGDIVKFYDAITVDNSPSGGPSSV